MAIVIDFSGEKGGSIKLFILFGMLTILVFPIFIFACIMSKFGRCLSNLFFIFFILGLIGTLIMAIKLRSILPEIIDELENMPISDILSDPEFYKSNNPALNTILRKIKEATEKVQNLPLIQMPVALVSSFFKNAMDAIGFGLQVLMVGVRKTMGFLGASIKNGNYTKGNDNL